ncbi:transposase [Rubripirellula lacrimiformis]|nr:transposase [Rubripirellula lacrimiformis]
MVDTLLAAFAMFSLKDPSLLAFEERSGEPAIKRLFGIDAIPSDTSMREILDGIDTSHLNEAFADIFHELQRGNVLREFAFHNNHYLLAIDGTGYFCSSKIHCPECLERKTSGGKIQYVHQAVAAVLVHPDQKVVIPLAIEPIVKQDGETKNDCERNATRRLLRRIRLLYPKIKLIVVEDGLASNAPHIADLKDLKMSYLLGAKPGDHAHLFDQVIAAGDEDRIETLTRVDPIGNRVIQSETQYVSDLALNASNQSLRVNFLQHFEYDNDSGEVSKRFSWVTNVTLDRSLLSKFTAGGRSRWRIENETFNTLKNQGYHFEHNYGHGKQNLSTVLMLLMFLAFMVDQVQQACCPLFASVQEKFKSRRALWEKLRSHVNHFVFESFAELWQAMLSGSAMGVPPPRG